jgi:two-component sensor histidine kinase
VYLLGFVAAVVIPLLAFAALLLTRYAAVERARYERDAAQIAQQVALVIDADLIRLVSLLKGLAASSALATGDLARFYDEAKRASGTGDEVVLLRELGPRQLLNTQVPFGSPLPPAIPISPGDRATLEQGRPLIGAVYRSPISDEPRIPVSIPVSGNGQVTYALAVTIPTSRVRDVLLPAVPPGWIVGIGDRTGTYVTRSARHEDVTGKPGVAEYLAKAVRRSGTFTSWNFEGVELLAGYRWSEFSDWLTAANIPRDVVEQPLQQSLALLVLVGAVALTLSGLLAYVFGGRFAREAATLAASATAMGAGRVVVPPPTAFREFAVVGEALRAAARAVEERTHELETVLETAPAAVWFTYDPGVRHVMRNRFAAQLMRVPEGEGSALDLDRGLLSHIQVLQNGQSVTLANLPLQRAMRGEVLEGEEYTFASDDGIERTLLLNARALRDEANEIVGAVSVGLDITDRKRGEEQRQLLIHELNHRVKNTLATVQSIAMQTLRSSTSTEEASRVLTERLITLSKAHDVLTRESWEGADLIEVIRGAVGAHMDAGRLRTSGPPVRIPPGLSLSFSLALHELATNAMKYGALSTSLGCVEVSWEVTREEVAKRLRLVWTERCGPPVAPPARQGFGTRLVERSLSGEPGGSVRIEYHPGGVVCIMEAELQQQL